MDNRQLAERFSRGPAKALGIKVVVGTPDDDFLVEFDGFVMVSEGTVRVTHPYIGAKTAEEIEVPGFYVSEAVYIPGTYWEPPDVDVVEVGEHRSLCDALEAALLVVVRNHVRNAMQAEGEAMQYEDWQQFLKEGKVEEV
jgi:hypothetical protein